MTEPLLEYRGELVPPPSNWRIGAWIYRMVLGILYQPVEKRLKS